MSRTGKVVSWILFIVVLVGFFWLAGQQAKNNAQLTATGAAGVLALIAATAIGIERIIEGIWTVMDQCENAWWPLNKISKQIEKLEGDLNRTLETVYANAEKAIKEPGKTSEWIDTETKQLPNLLTDMRQRISELQGLAKGNQRVNLVAATALQNIATLEQKYPSLQREVAVANQAIAGLTDFVASFKDNPARRMISLMVSAILGMLIAWVMGLDVFLAVFERAPQVTYLPSIGVALTGLLIGFGSGPTHDVVSFLQEVKKLRAAQNQPGPLTSEDTFATRVMSDSHLLSDASSVLPRVRRFR